MGQGQVEKIRAQGAQLRRLLQILQGWLVLPEQELDPTPSVDVLAFRLSRLQCLEEPVQDAAGRPVPYPLDSVLRALQRFLEVRATHGMVPRDFIVSLSQGIAAFSRILQVFFCGCDQLIEHGLRQIFTIKGHQAVKEHVADLPLLAPIPLDRAPPALHRSIEVLSQDGLSKRLDFSQGEPIGVVHGIKAAVEKEEGQRKEKGRPYQAAPPPKRALGASQGIIVSKGAPGHEASQVSGSANAKLTA